MKDKTILYFLNILEIEVKEKIKDIGDLYLRGESLLLVLILQAKLLLRVFLEILDNT